MFYSIFLYCIFLKADFMNNDQIYEDLIEFPKVKNQMEKTLLDYNEFPGQVPMDIVLFRDAIEHGK
jgi:hypothetical protein